MKTLEKDRTRRYETASGLASDIQHYLNSEPVAARPPSNAYRFQKLVRRNKLACATGTAVAAAVLVGLAVSTFLFIQERRAHDRALAAENEQSRCGKKPKPSRRKPIVQLNSPSKPLPKPKSPYRPPISTSHPADWGG